MAIEARGNDLICALSDGSALAADWRQLWTYRRLDHGDDALAIARHALDQAPELFSISLVGIGGRHRDRLPPLRPGFWSVQLHKGVSIVTAGIAKFGMNLKVK